MNPVKPTQSTPTACPEAKLPLRGSRMFACAVAIALSLATSGRTQGAAVYGLEWPGDGSVRRMLYWSDPFPIYDATYLFRVYPRSKDGLPHYYTTFFWGNNGAFSWDGGQPNTYYGAHPYPIPAPSGPGQWEIAVYSNDFVTGTSVELDRWYTQAFRAWRESPSITRHEFYWDLPDTTKVIRVTINNPDWADENPPSPAIVMGQAPNLNGSSWGGYSGWEEFNGIIRGIQIYSGWLSVADIQSELAAPKSTAAGQSLIWYLNVDPRPTDVTDKKAIGIPNNPSWDGVTASEWVGDDGTPVTTAAASAGSPPQLMLGPASPNPGGSARSVSFSVPSDGHVALRVFDVSGRRVATLVDRTLPTGHHEVPFLTDGWAPGVYFYRLAFGAQVRTGRLIVLR